MGNKSPCLFTLETASRKASFEITRSCNYSCAHCCTNSSHKIPEKMGTTEVKEAFNNLSSSGTGTVYVSGGEPFIRKDLVEVLESASSLEGLKKINIASNGSLIDDKTASFIRSHRKINTILISMDGHTADIHNRFRIAKNGFDNAVRAIETLVENSVKVRLGTVIWKDSIDNLREIAEMAYNLNVFELFYNWLLPVGRAMSSKEIAPQRERYLSIGSEIETIIKGYAGRLNIGYHRFKPIDNSFEDCPGGERYFHVLDDGRVSPCSWITKYDESFISAEKITGKPLDKILGGAEIQNFREMVQQRRELYGPGCPAVTMIETGSYFAPDPLKIPDGLFIMAKQT